MTASKADALADLERLTARYPALEASLALGERLTEPRPEISRWSPAQHLFHVFLANELSLRNALSLARGRGMLIKPFERTGPYTEAVLGGRSIPRGVARAPRFVTPPERVDLAFLKTLCAENLADLARVRDEVDAIVAAPLCVPHQLLGDLDAPQWLRFADVHTAHHAAILAEILPAVS
jgi:hypothetical protein